jgi:vacuolar-type H+-ATPase subunit E/Vma4
MELDDVYASKGLDNTAQPQEEAHEVIPEDTGDVGSPPEPVTTAEPEIDWKAEAEKAKAEAERVKREAEEAERKARGLEQAIAAAREKARKAEQPAFQENPEAYVQRVHEEVERRMADMRVEMLQTSARARHADYDDKEKVFVQLAQENPYLVAQLQQAPDPAEFAYKTAEYNLAMKEAGGSLEALKQRIAAELSTQKADEHKAKAAALPKGLGNVGTGRKSAAVFTGPTDLDSIYSRKR